VQTLAAIDQLLDFSAMAAAVDAACPRPDRVKGGRPPYAAEVLVRMVFLQGLYNLSDEQCEHQVSFPPSSLPRCLVLPSASLRERVGGVG
jgi:hypothetical protein